VYYLKATFGLGTSYSLLEIPVSVNGGGRCLTFQYQISSPKIVLFVSTLAGGRTKFSRVGYLRYTDQGYIGQWNDFEVTVDSDVRAIRLVAKKHGVTTDIQYVLVDVIHIASCYSTLNAGGNMPVAIFEYSLLVSY